MPKRILSGTVVSDKNDQTITVAVERRYTHPMMKKTVRSTKKYRAHDRRTLLRPVTRCAFRNARRTQKPNAGRS